MIHVPSSTTFATLVRSHRLQANITQDGLARAVRKSRRWVHDLEMGKVDPSLSAAIDVAAALGFTVTMEPSQRSELLDKVFEEL